MLMGRLERGGRVIMPRGKDEEGTAKENRAKALLSMQL